MLLRDLGSPKASKRFTIQHLAAVSPEEATNIGKVLEYEGDDITEVFGDAGWERVPNLVAKTLTKETKTHFVDAYIQLSFCEKIEDRYRHLSDGFNAVIGSSFMVQKMLDAKQLAHIVCGGDAPVEISAIRRYAVAQHWNDSDVEYIDAFWSVLANLPEAAKVQFVIFVTGSDRMPLQGWEELRVKVQKNGVGDERLPVAYTCFSLILLPKYSSVDVLRARVLAAIKDSQGFGLQ
jgi:ubiquitin-protein ligase E3 A